MAIGSAQADVNGSGLLTSPIHRNGSPSAGAFPGREWETLDPREAGWDVEKLAEARGMARGLDSMSLLAVHDGRIVLSYGEPGRKSIVASVRKSLLSALYGVQVAAGVIDLESTLEQLGIDDHEPPLTPAEKRATVSDLLKSRSGVYHVANSSTAWERSQVPPRGSHAPGAYWCYNNWDFNALGTIYERCTNRTIFADLKSQLAEPLGMQDFTLEDGWYYGQHFSKHPAYHMRLSARDLARFGLLYLNDGAWNGRQILPEAWVRLSTARHSDASFGLGYGYMWWIGMRKPFRTAIEEASYSARGYRGQRVHVIPGLRLVIVHQYAGRNDNDNGISDQKLGDLVDLIVAAHPEQRR